MNNRTEDPSRLRFQVMLAAYRASLLKPFEHSGVSAAEWHKRPLRSASGGDDELAKALTELKRVTRPGGRLLITVPYGRPDDFGWSRIFSRAMVERIVDVVDPVESTVTVFAYSAGGWQVSDLDAASDAVYRVHTIQPDPADLAATARAVACLKLTV